MMIFLICLACFVIGSWFGLIVCALMVAAGRSDDRENE